MNNRRAKERERTKKRRPAKTEKTKKNVGFANTNMNQATLWATANTAAGGGAERRLQKKTVQRTQDTAKAWAGSGGGGAEAAEESHAAHTHDTAKCNTHKGRR